MREKYCWLVTDKPDEQSASVTQALKSKRKKIIDLPLFMDNKASHCLMNVIRASPTCTCKIRKNEEKIDPTVSLIFLPLYPTSYPQGLASFLWRACPLAIPSRDPAQAHTLTLRDLIGLLLASRGGFRFTIVATPAIAPLLAACAGGGGIRGLEQGASSSHPRLGGARQRGRRRAPDRVCWWSREAWSKGPPLSPPLLGGCRQRMEARKRGSVTAESATTPVLTPIPLPPRSSPQRASTIERLENSKDLPPPLF
jgi:hypothetical protein